MEVKWKRESSTYFMQASLQPPPFSLNSISSGSHTSSCSTVFSAPNDSKLRISATNRWLRGRTGKRVTIVCLNFRAVSSHWNKYRICSLKSSNKKHKSPTRFLASMAVFATLESSKIFWICAKLGWWVFFFPLSLTCAFFSALVNSCWWVFALTTAFLAFPKISMRVWWGLSHPSSSYTNFSGCSCG